MVLPSRTVMASAWAWRRRWQARWHRHRPRGWGTPRAGGFAALGSSARRQPKSELAAQLLAFSLAFSPLGPSGAARHIDAGGLCGAGSGACLGQGPPVRSSSGFVDFRDLPFYHNLPLP